MKTLTAAAAAVAAVLCAGQAGAAQIDALDNGWYQSDGMGGGYHDPLNTNTFTSLVDGLYEYRSFYAFDLAGAGPATAISITFVGGNGEYYSADPSETVDLYDFLGSVGDLVAGGGNAATAASFADLGSGAKLGSATVFHAGSGPMPEFTVNLSAAFVAQYNAALASSDKRIALGAVLATPSDFDEALWSSSGRVPAAYLTVTGGAVPEPAGWALMLTGFASAGALVRRRRFAA